MNHTSPYTPKYIDFARNFSAREYANPAAYFAHRVDLIESWGPKTKPGEHILEIGCGDGYLAGLLLDRGYRLSACDMSPVMIETTLQKNQPFADNGRLDGHCFDINQFPYPLDGQYDHVVALMRSFFRYAQSPEDSLKELHRVTGRKLLADLNPRQTPVRRAIRCFKNAGFKNVRVRAYLVPQKVVLPTLMRRSLAWCERLPLYKMATWRKFHLLIVGEV